MIEGEMNGILVVSHMPRLVDRDDEWEVELFEIQNIYDNEIDITYKKLWKIIFYRVV